MPPSLMIGILYFFAAWAQLFTAVICGTPIPETTRVVQIEPGPIPTFTALAPASIKSTVASAVATFPAIISILGKLLRNSFTARNTFALCPWDESRAITSTPASIKAPARSMVPLMPTAAPTRSLPLLSLAELGYCRVF